MSHKLPKLILDISVVSKHQSFIVGSAADPNINNPRDFDIIVPFSTWNEVCMLIPKDAVPNTFGGWKCKSGESIVDVWPGELNNVIIAEMFKYAWEPYSNTRIKKM